VNFALELKMERKIIPAHIIAIISDIVAECETHASLDSLFMYAGAPGDPPGGSKSVKAQEWLRQVNKDENIDPLEVLGRIIEGYMEAECDPEIGSWADTNKKRKEKIESSLARACLQYVKGGRFTGQVAAPSKTLQGIIRGRDLKAINEEFERALVNVEANPREAISAASNILESICKTYIEDEGLEKPKKLDLKGVWGLVRKDLGFDPSRIEDQDLQQILTGLFSVVGGIGALRTHASSAHGASRKIYKLEPRHARLAIHSAHTVAVFIIESWDKKQGK
jgi:hypothetical protein